jgi:outer membrane phospholipase A
MKLSLAAFSLICLLLSLPSISAMDVSQHNNDSAMFNVDTLRGNYPDLWERTKKSSTLFKQRGKMALQADSVLDTNTIIVAEIKKQTNGQVQRAAEINDKIHFEDIYLDNKPSLDVARGKFVLNPYMTNYAYFDRIYDPSPRLEPRKRRFALKWQISIQVPVLIAKYSNTGIFMAFTNRSTFDLFNPNPEDSRPVTHKTFMPEGFLRLDCATFMKSAGIDQFVLQGGAQHESNGGVDDSLSLLDSRGITAKLYAQVCAKFINAPADGNRRYLFANKYKLMLNARAFKCVEVTDNKDIVKFIGYLDLNASYEFAPIVNWFDHARSLGVYMIDGFFAPGGSMKHWFPSYAIGISVTPPMLSNKSVNYPDFPRLPVTPYFRFFRGYNEFLITYDKITTVYGFGLRLRN